MVIPLSVLFILLKAAMILVNRDKLQGVSVEQRSHLSQAFVEDQASG